MIFLLLFLSLEPSGGDQVISGTCEYTYTLRNGRPRALELVCEADQHLAELHEVAEAQFDRRYPRARHPGFDRTGQLRFSLDLASQTPVWEPELTTIIGRVEPDIYRAYAGHGAEISAVACRVSYVVDNGQTRDICTVCSPADSSGSFASAIRAAVSRWQYTKRSPPDTLETTLDFVFVEDGTPAPRAPEAAICTP